MVKRALDLSAPVPGPTRQRTLYELLPAAAAPAAPSAAPSLTVDLPPPEPAPSTDSASLTELKALSVEDARTAWTRLRDGYADKSGRGYAAAIHTPDGCLVCQKVPNRQQNGYVQIAPLVEVRTRARRGEPRKIKPLPQNGHRLAVIAWHPEESRRHLLDDGWHASHRCANPRCIEPSHICVEPKSANEARKGCREHLEVWEVVLPNGERHQATPERPCPCTPPCITHVVTRNVIRMVEDEEEV